MPRSPWPLHQPSSVVYRLLVGHVAPVLVVSLALAMTLAALQHITSLLNIINHAELSTLHRESSLHHACWNMDVTMRRHERACHLGGDNHAAAQDIQQALGRLQRVLHEVPDASPAMQQGARGWMHVAHEVLGGDDMCQGLHDPTRQRRRAQLDESMTDLWTIRVDELRNGLEAKGDQAHEIGVRAVTVGTLLALLSLGLALNLARRMGRWVTTPLSELASTARQIGRGDFSTPVRVEGPAEIMALADELARMQEQLGQLEVLKQGFLASVSHELRTPLSKIREALALLHDGAVGPLDAKQLRVVQIARSACEREIRMVATLLDLSRLRTGSPLRFKDGSSVDAVINAAVEDEQMDAQARRVSIQSTREGVHPTCRLDPVLLERAVANLVRNAASVSPPGSSVLVARHSQERPGHPGLWVSITVSDQGPGVPPEIRETIFNAFVTSAVPQSPKAIGVGLGLALSREVAQAHGGDLLLEDTPQGATFRLWIPTLSMTQETERDDHE